MFYKSSVCGHSKDATTPNSKKGKRAMFCKRIAIRKTMQKIKILKLEESYKY